MSSVTEQQPETPRPNGPLEVESPIINSPFYEPKVHWEIQKARVPVKAQGRRPASYYFRVPEHAERGRTPRQQGALFGGAEVGQEEELALVNLLRQRVQTWREGTLTGREYEGASKVTRELLALWKSEDRMQRLFFAQIEAAETIIFLTEAAEPYRNVTIRERLQELDPALGDLSLYRTRQLVPPQRMEELRRGEVMIANWHRLAKQETSSVNGQSARVVKTGEPVEVVKNTGQANETVEVKYVESDAA